MTLNEREVYIDAMFARCRKILESKGKDYSGTVDSLANFKENAERLGLTKYQILSVYLNKHLDSIMRSIKAHPEFPQVESEPLEGRIEDAINYLGILGSMIHEDVHRSDQNTD